MIDPTRQYEDYLNDIRKMALARAVNHINIDMQRLSGEEQVAMDRHDNRVRDAVAMTKKMYNDAISIISSHMDMY